jgi:hypothetical protein
MGRGLSSTDDPANLFAGLGIHVRRGVNDEHSQVADHADSLPALFVRERIRSGRMMRVLKDTAGQLEA